MLKDIDNIIYDYKALDNVKMLLLKYSCCYNEQLIHIICTKEKEIFAY